jgi:translation initiation factor eIF-2B subunit delta
MIVYIKLNFSDTKLVHPAIVKLGLQYATRQIVGSNLRCVAFLVAIQKVLNHFLLTFFY